MQFSLQRRLADRPSTELSHYADATFNSLGPTSIPRTTPIGIPNIFVKLDVVAAAVPSLLGLDALDAHALYANNVSNMWGKKTARGSKKYASNYREVEYADGQRGR